MQNTIESNRWPEEMVKLAKKVAAEAFFLDRVWHFLLDENRDSSCIVNRSVVLGCALGLS